MLGQNVAPRNLLIWLSLFVFAYAMPASGEDWPAWRGKSGSGFSSEQDVPIKWGVNENILWKRPTPGAGHSSPIVWKDQIVMTYANLESQTRHVMSVDRETGKTLWDSVVAKGAIEEMHRDNSPASATPVTDGKAIYVVFCKEGILQVNALDFSGKILWETNAGPFESRHGFSTAMVLHEHRLLLSGLQDGSEAFVAAINSVDGSLLWKVPREKAIRSFSSPCVVEIQGESAIILSGSNQTIAYRCDDGKVLWTLDGPASKTVSSIVVAEELGLAFVCGGRDGQFYAIRYDQVIENEQLVKERLVAWSLTKGIPYVTSPYYHDGILHVVSDDGIYRSYVAESGKPLVNRRVATKVDASMVGWNDNVLITDAEGETKVIRNSPKFELLATNDLQESIVASPAISSGDIVIRTTSNLYLIRADAKQAP